MIKVTMWLTRMNQKNPKYPRYGHPSHPSVRDDFRFLLNWKLGMTRPTWTFCKVLLWPGENWSVFEICQVFRNWWDEGGIKKIMSSESWFLRGNEKIMNILILSECLKTYSYAKPRILIPNLPFVEIRKFCEDLCTCPPHLWTHWNAAHIFQ